MLIAPLADAPASGANGDATHALYRVEDPFYRVVQPLDPMTLRDRGQPASFATDTLKDTSLSLSADGSTAVTGQLSVEGTDWTLNLRVVDTGTGTVRSAFAVAGRDAYVAALSRDGGRAVVTTTAYDKHARRYATAWTVYDTMSGQPLSAFERTYPDGQVITSHVDGAAEQMWLQSNTEAEPFYGTEASVGALVLQHIDLRTGVEVGRLTVGSVEVGYVERVEVVEQAPVFESVEPAIALSPDGRTIAIVAAATEEIILLDGMSMARIDTVTAHEPESLAHRLLGWAGLMPASAGAKFQVGEWRTATFSADGASLYLTGGRGEIVGDTYEDYEAEWLGIRRVDLETGEISAAALDGEQVDQVVPTASGELYVLGPDRPWTEVESPSSTVVLSRLDAETLEVDATRTLEGDVWTVLVTQP